MANPEVRYFSDPVHAGLEKIGQEMQIVRSRFVIPPPDATAYAEGPLAGGLEALLMQIPELRALVNYNHITQATSLQQLESLVSRFVDGHYFVFPTQDPDMPAGSDSKTDLPPNLRAHAFIVAHTRETRDARVHKVSYEGAGYQGDPSLSILELQEVLGPDFDPDKPSTNLNTLYEWRAPYDKEDPMRGHEVAGVAAFGLLPVLVERGELGNYLNLAGQS